ncbi:hypothetical protein, partial [Klebsiella pneumoniae]
IFSAGLYACAMKISTKFEFDSARHCLVPHAEIHAGTPSTPEERLRAYEHLIAAEQPAYSLEAMASPLSVPHRDLSPYKTAITPEAIIMAHLRGTFP